MASPTDVRSPASIGVGTGLFLALAVALGVLLANDSWLLPALDDRGAEALAAAASLAAGGPATVPVSTWDAPDSPRGVSTGRAALPLLMSRMVRAGIRPHVTGLWVMAGGLAAAALAVSWVAGGAAGVPGGIAAVALLIGSSAVVRVGTVLGVDAASMAATAVLLGALVYRPRWSVVHGAVAGVAWVLAPLGLGAVLAAGLWPLSRPHRTPGDGGVVRSGIAWLGAGVAVGAAVALHPLLLPGVPGWGGSGPAGAVGGLVGWVGAGLSGPVAMVVAALAAVAAGVLSAADRRAGALPPSDTPWYDPAVRDLLAARARRAGSLVAGAVAVAAVADGGTGGWVAVVPPLAAVVGLSAVRAFRRRPDRLVTSALAVLALWLVVSGLGAAAALRSVRAEGAHHTARVWVASPVVRWLDNQVPADLPIYADAPFLVHVQTGRSALDLAGALDRPTAFVEAFRRRPGVVVVTGAARTWADEDLGTALGLATVVDAPEGRILVPRPGGGGGR